MALTLAGISTHLLSHIRSYRIQPRDPLGQSPDRLQASTLSKLRFRSLGSRLSMALFFLGLVAVPLIPVANSHLSIAAILSSLFSELSSLSVLAVVASFFPGAAISKSRRFLAVAVFAGGLLYWSVLTYGSLDLYRYGFLQASTGQHGILGFLLGLALVSLFLPLKISVLIALSCLSWSLGFQASSNLWDYLLDVPAFLIYLGYLISTLLARPANA
jgi:hypothetical protein